MMSKDRHRCQDCDVIKDNGGWPPATVQRFYKLLSRRGRNNKNHSFKTLLFHPLLFYFNFLTTSLSSIISIYCLFPLNPDMLLFSSLITYSSSRRLMSYTLDCLTTVIPSHIFLIYHLTISPLALRYSSQLNLSPSLANFPRNIFCPHLSF